MRLSFNIAACHRLKGIIWTIFIVWVCIGCASSDSSSNDSGSTNTSQPDQQATSIDLAFTRWIVLEISDSEGKILTPKDPVNYVLVFDDPEIYEHTVVCQPYAGFYKQESALLTITEAAATGAADCPISPNLDMELVDYLVKFYADRTLDINIQNNELVLRGLNNDFIRYNRCKNDCFLEQ